MKSEVVKCAYCADSFAPGCKNTYEYCILLRLAVYSYYNRTNLGLVEENGDFSIATVAIGINNTKY